MATATATPTTTIVRKHVEYISPARQYTLGAVMVGLGVLTWWLFARTVEGGILTKFGLTPGGSSVVIPDLVFPTKTVLYVLAALQVLLGVLQLFLKGGFKQRTNLVLFLVATMFIVAFLAWGAGGKSLNVGGLLKGTLSKAVPLTLGAMAGILCERAGVVNIAIEGMMLAGAFGGAFIGSISGNLWVGVAAGAGIGMLMGVIHALLSINYKTNQIISGTVINILATGLTSYFSAKFLQSHQDWNNPGIFQPIKIPGLSQIPLLGPILFDNNLYVYAMFFFLFLLQFALFYTRWGLRHRSVGEHPRAADTLGINVIRTRWIAVLLGAAMAGFAGSYFTLGSVGKFNEVMTAGRGFIALAAMVFGNWMPFGSFGAGLLFGFFDALASKLAILGIQIPSQFLLMLPYLITIVVIAGVVGRTTPPAADGIPYEKEGG
jgi:general nucleoside transport system permease protein